MTRDDAPKGMPGVTLPPLSKLEGPATGYETVMLKITVPAGTLIGRHTHPGIENTYVLEGSGELMIEGSPSRHLQAGDAFQVPPGAVHSVQIGDTPASVCSVLVVEMGKPLVIPVSQPEP
jgi:quercetin dioxygenase-like cupin family protein